jgi:hypothetical protein
VDLPASKSSTAEVKEEKQVPIRQWVYLNFTKRLISFQCFR